MAFYDSLLGMLPWTGTAPVITPAEDVEPRVDGKPYGQSGRINYGGFIQEDELNAALSGRQGLRTFDEIYRSDPDIRRNVLAVWTPVQAATFSVEPFGGDDAEDVDREAQELCEWVLWQHMSPDFPAHLATLGPVLLRSGFTPFEQIWETAEWEGKTVTVLRKLDLRLPRTVWRFFQDEYGDLTGIEQSLPNAQNAYIPSSELLYYRLQAEGDNWQGTSLLRQAYKPWYYKDKLERIDAIGQERKAVGVPLIFPPQSASPGTKGEVETVFANLHTNDVSYAMLPGPKAGTSGTDSTEGWTVEIVKFDSSAGDTIQKSIDAHQRKIAGAFLADFLELGHHQVGARATAQVQEDPFLTAVEALGQQILGPLNMLLKRIAYLNFPNLKGAPTLRMSMHDVASLSEIATYAATLIAAGAMTADPDTEDYLRERADFPAVSQEFRDEKEALRKAGQQAALQAASETPQDIAERESGEKQETAKLPDSSKRKPDQEPAKPAKGRKKLEEGDANWWENMLSQGRLVEALDNARGTMQKAATAATVKLARDMAARGKAGRALSINPPPDLTEALQTELVRLYVVGQETVEDELAKQREVLGTMELAAPTKSAAGGALLHRARKRARVGARHITQQVARTVERAVVNGVTDPLMLQRQAEATAVQTLRAEAVANASQSINDGRTAAARAAQDVVGGIYTSVLDQNTCDQCAIADDGVIREPDDAALEVPNGMCAGQERCRCMVVFVLSTDPAVIGAA